MNTSSKLLINESPLTVLPSLVCLVGLERALLLQQIQYLLHQKNIGRILDDGEKYIWNTAQEFKENWFSFWEADSIRKHLKKLETDGYLITRKPLAAQRNHTKFYRIDYEKLDAELKPPADVEVAVENESQDVETGAPDSEYNAASNRKIIRIESEYDAASESEYDAGSLKESKTSTKTSKEGGGGSSNSASATGGKAKPPPTAADNSPPKTNQESQPDYLLRKQLEYPHLDVEKIFKDFRAKCGSDKYPKLKLTRPQFDRWLETEFPPMDAPTEEERAGGAAFDEQEFFTKKLAKTIGGKTNGS